MKQPTFFEGIVVALAASLAGSALYAGLSTFVSGAEALRLLITAIGLGYVIYLLSRSREPVGRVTVLVAWALMAGAILIVDPPLVLYLIAHAGTVWLVRSLYFYSSALSALTDLGLNGLALSAATWAANQSGSLFLSIWSFFLVQALFVGIPSTMRRKRNGKEKSLDPEDRFERARRIAEAALRKLSSAR
jgi:hypothetical protein